MCAHRFPYLEGIITSIILCWLLGLFFFLIFSSSSFFSFSYTDFPSFANSIYTHNIQYILENYFYCFIVNIFCLLLLMLYLSITFSVWNVSFIIVIAIHQVLKMKKKRENNRLNDVCKLQFSSKCIKFICDADDVLRFENSFRNVKS